MKFKAFCIIPHPGEIEIKPLVLCRECQFFDCAGCVLGHQCKADGDWFCADGEKRKEDSAECRMDNGLNDGEKGNGLQPF